MACVVPRHVFVSRDLGHTRALDDPPEGWPHPALAGREHGATLLEQGPLASADGEPRTPHQGLVRLEESSFDSGACSCWRGGPVDAPPPTPEQASGTVNPVPRPHGGEFSEGSSEDNFGGVGEPSGGLIEEVFNPKIEDHDDYIVINGMRMNKPLVEKPVNAEDHNICIYYPRSMGGGCKQLFRKVKNRSSSFDPDINHVRRDGSYIYEEFLTTQGTDIKVCVCAHAPPLLRGCGSAEVRAAHPPCPRRGPRCTRSAPTTPTRRPASRRLWTGA